MDTQTSSSSILEPELYFLIARFLSSGPCQRATKVLLEELDEFKLLPQRVDWEGKQHNRSYENLVYLNRHIRSDHLLRIVERVGALLDKEIKPSVPGVRSLLGAGSLSLLRTSEGARQTKWSPAHHMIRYHGAPLYPPVNLAVPAVPHVLKGYETSGVVRHHSVVPTSIFSRFSMHGRKLGHLSAVYCVLFDRTGSCIFTGADDALVKIWSTFDMRLLATLRGHSAEITDMAVSYENTLLASGSCDKVVRVWCLRSKATAAVLQAHSSMITSVQFCPKSIGDTRYLVSTGNDGCVCFWQFNCRSNVFSQKPVKFVERSRAGAQMLCSSFSPGGAFLATGNSDHVVRVYFLHSMGIEKICELEAHTDKVDSICYSNCLNRFVSGSNDGTARIWRYERQEWRATVLNMNAKLTKCPPTPEQNRNVTQDQLRVTMVSWSMDDAMVITAVSDFSIKVWNAYTGALLQVLEGHEDEVFVVEASPSDARILLSAGHDGKMILWDIYTGVKIKKFFNLIEGQGHGAVFDCKFSPDGHSLAATDSHGHLLLMGLGTNDRCKKIPQQLFFHTDYRPLIRDANNYVLDEQTQQPPHLMPPPFLVDIDGNPYPANIQRLVPGRENCNDASLVPQIVVNAHGESEVIGDIDVEGRVEPPQVPNGDVESEADDDEEDDEEDDDRDVRPGSMRISRSVARPSIDVMIEELQRQQDQRLRQDQRPRQDPGSSSRRSVQVMSPPQLSSPFTPRSNLQNRIGMRRSGEIEGVRQSLGNVAVRSTKKERDAARRHVTVRPLDLDSLKAEEEKRSAYGEDEIKRFLSERKKKLLSPYETNTASILETKKRGQKSKKASDRQREEDVPENVETARNRLTTRALYDTEEEEEEDGGSDLDLWNSENTSDDYSDWVGDQADSNLEPPKRRSQRKRVRRRLYSSSNDDDEGDKSDSSTTEESSEEEKEDGGNDEPSTSSRRELKQKTASQNNTGKKKQKTKKRKKPRLVPADPNLKPVTQLDEKMKPPEWITTVIPRKAPFVPQMGDEVVYFRQGHEQYLLAVLRKQVYKVHLDKNQPWHKIPNLRAQELVKIVGIKWLITPTRLCCLKLAFMDSSSGRLTGRSFTIKYHDMPDVIDFLVLKQHYDISVERGWKPGVRFRSMIDDQWWLGAIKSQEPLNPEFPDSLFQCFNVQWDNGEYEKISPWDMEPIDPKRKPATVGGGVSVTQDEYKALLYVPKRTEWPSCGREAESQRLTQGLGILMQHSIAESFNAPVDLQKFPTYACFVSYPIDLSTIKTRLENGFYRRITALQWDVRLIAANASIFNKSGSVIVKNANAISETLLRFIKDHTCQDPLPMLTELAHSDMKMGSSDEDSHPGSSGKTSKSRKSPNRKKHKHGPKADPDVWVEQCESLLATLFECEDSEPFRVPVDPALYPDYEDIVKNPMDLTTVHTKLATGHYGNPVDLCRDIRLMFQNSKIFNTNKRSRIYSMTLRLSALFEAHIVEIIKNWKLALKASGRVRKHHRPGSSTSAQTLTSWDAFTSSIFDSSQPSSSTQPLSIRLPGKDGMVSALGSSSSSSQQMNGHFSGFKRSTGVNGGDDSDATIVDKDDKDDDGDTEVCDEETGVNGHFNNTDDDDVSDDDDDKDNDYRPTNFRLHSGKSAMKGKGSTRGKGKSTRPLPTRTVRERLKKSNVFYTSDGNSNVDDLSGSDCDEELTKVPSRKCKSKISSKSPDDSDNASSDELSYQASRRKTPRSSLAAKRRPAGRSSSFKKYPSSDYEGTPSHRKARGTRSKKRAVLSEEEEEEVKSRIKKNSSSALSRSARSARTQKKSYAEDESDLSVKAEDEDDDEVELEDDVCNNLDSEEESSEEVDEDSEDELITKSLRKSTKDSKKASSKSQKRSKLDSHSNDSDSDSLSNVPRKRTRLRTSPQPKHSRRTSKSHSPPVNKISNKRVKNGQKSGSTRQTRNRGKQRVTYIEDDSDEDNDSGDSNSDSDNLEEAGARNVSSRGRVRKLTARARASFKKQMGLTSGLYAG
ncbi:unnamed protein product [Candidula unifasciata]|uniref:Bromo domain-containing protein n=1 Tax=Candidula unifasciata TaxID=100452 RepID=A0A8S3YMZ7_9EUPU|nr:unnamed protein product [Candidula unifasciata]